MKMRLFGKTKQGLKRIFGVGEIKGNYENIKEMAKGFYDYNTHKIGQTGIEKTIYIPRTFLQKRERDFRNLFLLFALIFVLSLLYLLVSLFAKLWTQSLLILCFSLFIGALCFRYHFWWIQIKKKKLGCTLQEWKEETLKEISELSGRDQK